MKMAVASAGRLSWELTYKGIVVAIPVRWGTGAIRYAPLIGLWLAAVLIRFWPLLASLRPYHILFELQLIGIGVYGLVFCASVCWLVWMLTGESVLILDPIEMTIQRRVIGILLVTRTFPTKDASHLRFVPPAPLWASPNERNPGTSKIEFKVGDKTCSFGKGISEGEARVLIEQMLLIYKFPGT